MGDVRPAWQRLVDWLETNAPATASSVLAPATPAAITAAEERMGVGFPVELRTWLLASGADNGPVGVTEGVVPGNRDVLGLAAMERTYHFKREIERDDPSDDPEFPFWHEQWIPIVSDDDACYGMFLDVRSGRIGSFGDGDAPSFGVHESLTALFSETAVLMEQISAGAQRAAGRVQDGRLIWD
ncbi:SMI1/KNR4 family protein [Streptomyces brevispora]|uniref:Cell wall assembly regulator SMI1 n=1 Tax=Streptomyces brevispora TaxID=887462 RepID=A0A561V0T8_9ACTN|nr:cell wall assembly regulator SMI1 [Streptomyces brevispora]